MKIALIGEDFEKDAGQGVYKYGGYLLEGIIKNKHKIQKIKLKKSKNPVITVFESFLGSVFKILGKKADIYHFITPDMISACILKRPSIATVYDLIPFILKNERKKSYNVYFKIVTKFLKRANHFIVISKSTKKDLMKYLKVPEEKISLIYLGVDHKIFYPIKKKKNKKFVIGYLGGLGKRKNIEYMLHVAKKIGNKNDIIFKIAGKGPDLNRLIKIKNRLKLKNTEFVGFIPENKLNEFYNSLDLFIFPSYYEGFGLPILEAMACGIPVIASNKGSLPEIMGGAGILINPHEPKEAIVKIKKIVKNGKLQEKLGMRGIKRAKNFDWDKTTKETLKLYEKFI